MPDLHALNTLDWVVLSLMLWSIGWAAWKGFAREVFSLLGLAAAFFITIHAGYLLDEAMKSMVPDDAVAQMFGRAIMFLCVIIVINIVAGLGANALRAMLSPAVDHSLGLLFGFLRGALIVLLPYTLVNLYIDPKVYPDWLTKAQSFHFLEGGANMLRHVMPERQIQDDKRTDFKKMEKMAEETEKLEEVMRETDGPKDEKKKDSSGNSMGKDLVKTLKEIFVPDEPAKPE